MPNGLVTPGLVLQVTKAASDYVITQDEFEGILGTISSIFIGVAAMGFLGMLIGGITNKVTKKV